MSNKRPIHYEQHPVSLERKAALIAQGYRIVDAKFAPPGAQVETVTYADGTQATGTAPLPVQSPSVKPRGKPGPKSKAGR